MEDGLIFEGVGLHRLKSSEQIDDRPFLAGSDGILIHLYSGDEHNFL